MGHVHRVERHEEYRHPKRAGNRSTKHAGKRTNTLAVQAGGNLGRKTSPLVQHTRGTRAHLISCFHAPSETDWYALRMATISGARMSASHVADSEPCHVMAHSRKFAIFALCCTWRCDLTPAVHSEAG